MGNEVAIKQEQNSLPAQQTVYVDCNKGKFVGMSENLYLVDTGKTIVKSEFEPVTHELAEGWYIYKGNPVYLTHYTAWKRDGRLEPVYKYADHSRPPFGSNCVLGEDLKKLSPCENPYLSEDQVLDIVDAFDSESYPVEKEIRALKSKLAEIVSRKNEALKQCQHKWAKDGDEVIGDKSFLGRSASQEWCCETCGKSYTSHYTNL